VKRIKAKPMDVSPEAIEKRTDAIIAAFRGKPEEFGMLKGLLLLDSALRPAEDTMGTKVVKSKYVGSFEMPLTSYEVIRPLYDGVKIAARMDEINSEIVAKSIREIERRNEARFA